VVFHITASPNPCEAPCWILVCFNFNSYPADPAATTLTMKFESAGTDYDVNVDSAEPCVPVYIPPGCTGLTVVDKNGVSEDCAVAVG
jgi:hypothetical protein